VRYSLSPPSLSLYLSQTHSRTHTDTDGTIVQAIHPGCTVNYIPVQCARHGSAVATCVCVCSRVRMLSAVLRPCMANPQALLFLALSRQCAQLRLRLMLKAKSCGGTACSNTWTEHSRCVTLSWPQQPLAAVVRSQKWCCGSCCCCCCCASTCFQ
jgi:hypothetical protein